MGTIEMDTSITATADSYASVSHYLDDLKRFPPLSETEFDRLIALAAAGDRDAVNRIAQGNLRFVVRVASAFAGSGVPMDDLIAEGNLGLIKAVEKFDPSLGYKFTTYAVWWIRNAIQKSIRLNRHALRLPVNRFEDLDRINRSAGERSQHLGRNVSPSEAAEELDMSPRRSAAALTVQDRPVSMDALADEEGTRDLHQCLPNSGTTPDQDVIRKEASTHVQMALAGLRPRDAEVLRLTFGLEDDPLNLAQIGQHFGISKERVRQIRNRAMGELREILAGKNGYAN